ncbi:hypothetical protein VSAK1_08331 [Vibrio mediterranei AK1]|uniref:hypothetical protein n=1 Tax=Vibrio mediterranei TaxID=689 RepID=UPI0001541DC7|nr:hypothetical protein [Vibrio mediterranei]EDL54002.1 hypothetical protein VSAK1_08331 [Vibrio mediterranei AK1]
MSNAAKTKKNVAKAIGDERAEAVENWLASTPEIPLYQGRANQAAIGRKFNITKSTWGSNPRLKKLWKQIKVTAAQQVSDSGAFPSQVTLHSEETRKLLKEKDQLIGWLRRELARAELKIKLMEQDAAVEELLILTGRVARYDMVTSNVSKVSCFEVVERPSDAT